MVQRAASAERCIFCSSDIYDEADVTVIPKLKEGFKND